MSLALPNQKDARNSISRHRWPLAFTMYLRPHNRFNDYFQFLKSLASIQRNIYEIASSTPRRTRRQLKKVLGIERSCCCKFKCQFKCVRWMADRNSWITLTRQHKQRKYHRKKKRSSLVCICVSTFSVIERILVCCECKHCESKWHFGKNIKCANSAKCECEPHSNRRKCECDRKRLTFPKHSVGNVLVLMANSFVFAMRLHSQSVSYIHLARSIAEAMSNG